MKFRNLIIIAFALLSVCSKAFAQNIVTVSPDEVIGHIKIMNAANNGPKAGNFEDYKALRIPYARTHDTPYRWNYHTVDIDRIFPDWNANVNNPKSYDFALTDELLAMMIKAGTEPFFRLGQSIEHASKKYGIFPPKDFRKWAKICEHIIRHYTEGWADGYHWDIKYWEIWNEPDLDAPNDRWKTDPRCWGGSMEQFHEFYAVAAKHLKKCFPDLMIGGPALANPRKYGPAFLEYVKENEVPLDFFSWHMYHRRPVRISEDINVVRNMLDDLGFTQTESILNEWNYVRKWEEPDDYSAHRRLSIKGCAFVAGVMCECQNAPVDMLMYYDLRPDIPFNGVFSPYFYELLPTYFSLYYWAELRELGIQYASHCDADDIYTCAAGSEDGKLRILVTRYNEDDSVKETRDVSIAVPQGYVVASVRLTDSQEEADRKIKAQGDPFVLTLEPNAVALVELFAR